MSNLQPNCCLKFDFQKVDQHAAGKWLIHDTNRHKDNQLQSLKLPNVDPDLSMLRHHMALLEHNELVSAGSLLLVRLLVMLTTKKLS